MVDSLIIIPMYWGGNCGKKNLRNLRSYIGSEAELACEGGGLDSSYASLPRKYTEAVLLPLLLPASGTDTERPQQIMTQFLKSEQSKLMGMKDGTI